MLHLVFLAYGCTVGLAAALLILVCASPYGQRELPAVRRAELNDIKAKLGAFVLGNVLVGLFIWGVLRIGL